MIRYHPVNKISRFEEHLGTFDSPKSGAQKRSKSNRSSHGGMPRFKDESGNASDPFECAIFKECEEKESDEERYESVRGG